MKHKAPLKLLIWIVIGIIVYFSLEFFIGEVVIATTKETETEVDMSSFIWLIIVIGGIIASTLSYVSWRKYKGEKEQKQLSNDDK
ncbi:sporulation protein YpjB [Ornithinibacillus halotolerans]|uniref:Uncharacterized protein n=1 Tax=Ornithinibacillus halotolerans TaxID=1274357 RepID=A0A916RN45_9BACI|nr:sporulation protein YpjB [Ornithinibacillus halotolerans]GGA61409.1 hypothetical protein GCM10008025_01740 [Ornithinibacillus halotolerans]